MDPVGQEDVLDLSRDKSPNQGAYVYQPANPGKTASERPAKRRKVSSAHDQGQAAVSQIFVPLLNGEENLISTQLRHDCYKQIWSRQEDRIQAILEDVDAGVLADVLSFVRDNTPETCNGCIPTGLVTVGSNVSSLSRLLSRLNDQLLSNDEGGVVVLESGDAPNLKTTLKNVIRAVITNTEGNDGYHEFLTDRSGPRLLSYDLDLLHEYVQRKGTKKLVLAFRDSEAFDPVLLMDLLSLLKSWLDRIPFTVLLGISTSVELFEGRLPRACISLLQGKHFEVQDAGNCVDRIYESLQAGPEGKMWLGRNVTSTLLEKTHDYFQTPEAFSRMVKHAYMSHFFANPLSVLLANPSPATLSHPVLCEAIRNTPSFRMFCEDLIESGSPENARNLIESDETLLQEAISHVEIGQQSMRRLFGAIGLIFSCLQHTQSVKKTNISDLSVRGLSGDLSESQVLDDMLATMRTFDSEKMGRLLDTLPEAELTHLLIEDIRADFASLVGAHARSLPLRSEYNINSSVMKTTVVQQRILLSKGKSNLAKRDLEYTRIVDRLVGAFQEYFAETLIQPQELFMHEAFLFDFRNPLKETFTPRPRFAIERALANPFDYLVSSADTSAARISVKQPPTAILYQLYLESGALVNIHDLWQTFYSVFESEQGDACDERLVMALFYGALSDLRSFGMVKNSRKKTDHLSKSVWIGL
ncbi:Uncharacterized protein PECH_006761 [Penicillium ucsense]|uniref:Origin recognition complex subunit 3 n=1 Tax=Penicillium ucsense TaxID=2839758 RepID=A0A8J8VZY6_9EURO|nr:Uncharacterized protein PECM_000464 [Penicillium ucsense]KAF7735348.1 Uncharacterized protein PECH_006761 [Penicillium ucsense]